jgi:hypothetical protein
MATVHSPHNTVNNQVTSSDDPTTVALPLLLPPGHVFELRILGTAHGTLSGYFDDPAALVAEARKWSGHAEGCYVTLNPVNPALLARARNRLILRPKHATSDTDVIERRWLFLDADPVRPAGVSSSDAEHHAALVRMQEVLDWLVETVGFPRDSLLSADSGNGGHGLGRIQLPNDAASLALIKRCVEAVALHFSDETVTIDLTVTNAARIVKLYGTMTCKGEDCPDRPHRRATILSAPKELTIAPRGCLERLAALAPQEDPKGHARYTRNGHGDFDLPTWIAAHCPDAKGPYNWNGGHKWIFDVCPWNADHTNRAAFIVELAGGGIAARCHHNGCAGNDWHALRELREPGGREARGQPPPESGANGHAKPNPWDLAKTAPDFLAEEEPAFVGILKDMLAPGVVTVLGAPRGLGKSQFSDAIAVCVTTGGVYRGEQVRPIRALLVDRDNPKRVLKNRLRSWGAAAAANLHILTREQAPDLKDREAWEHFPVEKYDLVIVDSVGSSTEGITETQGKETTEVLATLRDLAQRGPAVLLLGNTTKDGLVMRGRGEWGDRVDIVYEVRDATGFTPSGKKDWWLELPPGGEAEWAERAARRKGRSDFRLAFIVSKFRIGTEPGPFCIELSLPQDALWTLREVTAELVKAGEAAVKKQEEAKNQKIKELSQALLEVVQSREALDSPLLKKEAEEFLRKERGTTSRLAIQIVENGNNAYWRIKEIEGAKGHPKALLSLPTPPTKTEECTKYIPLYEIDSSSSRETGISHTIESTSVRNNPPLQPAKNATPSDALFRTSEESGVYEIPPAEAASNAACRLPSFQYTPQVTTEEKAPCNEMSEEGENPVSEEFDWESGELQSDEEEV